MVIVVLDGVLLVSASRSEREGKRYSKSIFILQCGCKILIFVGLYLGMGATVGPWVPFLKHR